MLQQALIRPLKGFLGQKWGFDMGITATKDCKCLLLLRLAVPPEKNRAGEKYLGRLSRFLSKSDAIFEALGRHKAWLFFEFFH